MMVSLVAIDRYEPYAVEFCPSRLVDGRQLLLSCVGCNTGYFVISTALIATKVAETSVMIPLVVRKY